MPPLTRQRTLDSVLSWWSDSNPAGPTISIHAAAKPVMRLMYHREALALIRSKRGGPLSKETIDIYSSYLSFKYVSFETKAAILIELRDRAVSTNDAATILDSIGLNLVEELLNSPDTENVNVVECAADALYWIANYREGRQACVDAKILYFLQQLLLSPEPELRILMCSIVGALALHDNAETAVVAVEPYIISDLNLDVIWNAAYALCRIAGRPEDAQVVLDASALNAVAELLASPKDKVRIWTCNLVGELARHETTWRAVLKANPCIQLASLLRRVSNTDLLVIERAAKALFEIAKWPDGAQAVADTNALDCVPELLQSPSSEVRRWIYEMLGILANHRAVLTVKPSAKLIHRPYDTDVPTDSRYTIVRDPRSSTDRYESRSPHKHLHQPIPHQSRYCVALTTPANALLLRLHPLRRRRGDARGRGEGEGCRCGSARGREWP
ncbi:armadillo-type protein, partial [Mycena vulgaris]